MSLSRQNSARSSKGRINPGLNGQPSIKNGQANAIKVIARFRPFEGESCVDEMGDHHVKIQGVAQPFVLDAVLGPTTEQRDVFERCVKPTVEGVLNGYNGCVSAYGQTGSGKSHTMMGSTGSERGVIPRIVEFIFKEKSEQVNVAVGYMEIYNEKVRDSSADQDSSSSASSSNMVKSTSASNMVNLMNGNSQPTAAPTNAVNSSDLKVHEHAGGGGFYVKGSKKVQVSRAEDVFTIMNHGNRNRSTAATLMNQSSSRSHSSFLIDITTPTTQSKLVLVDLAGSEKVAKTGVRGLMLEEASNINKSLTSLGMVVNALAANQALVSKTCQNASVGSVGSTGSVYNGMHSNGSSSNILATNGGNSNGSSPKIIASNGPTSIDSASGNSSTSTSPILTGNSFPQDVSSSHVPFRDSKLTRILQDSSSGNSRTCLIVHCSPALTQSSETSSTLRFGIRAKSVQTQVMVNYVPSSASSNVPIEVSRAQQQLNAQLSRENQRLQAQHQRIVAQRNMQRRRIEQLSREIDEMKQRTTTDAFSLVQELYEIGPRVARMYHGQL